MQKYLRFNKKRNKKLKWEKAPDVEKKIEKLVHSLNLDWIKLSNVHCFRSQNSTSFAYARIWGLTKIWQIALDENPHYVIEVLSEHFDTLPEVQKDKILLHELAHIPKNFSGSLLPHVRKKRKNNFKDRVENLFAEYLRKIRKTKK